MSEGLNGRWRGSGDPVYHYRGPRVNDVSSGDNAGLSYPSGSQHQQQYSSGTPQTRDESTIYQGIFRQQWQQQQHRQQRRELSSSVSLQDQDSLNIYPDNQRRQQQQQQQRQYPSSSFHNQDDQLSYQDTRHSQQQQQYQAPSEIQGDHSFGQTQSTEVWPMCSDIELQPVLSLPGMEGKGNIDVDELKRYVSHNNADPWSSLGAPTGSSHNLTQPANIIYTPGPFSEPGGPVNKRQRLGTSSAVSATDSGFVSFNATSGPSKGPGAAWPLPAEQHDFMLGATASYPFPTSKTGSVTSEPTPYHSTAVSSSPHRSQTRRMQQRATKSSPLAPCESCGKVPKNRSDAHKHQQQHEKKHHCDEPGCPRQEGFATVNDLDRHKSSVHRISPSVGNKFGYICVACPPPTGHGVTPKFWPRRDNFKAHIRRKHQSYNENTLLSASESMRPPGVTSESGYGSTMQSYADPQDVPNQLDISSPHIAAPVPGLQASQGDYPFDGGMASGSDDQLAGIGEQLANQSVGDREPHAGTYGSSSTDNLGGLHLLSDLASAAPLASPIDSVLATPQISYDDASNQLATQHVGRGGPQRLSLTTPQWGSQLRKPNSLTRPDDLNDSLTFKSYSPTGQYVCNECGKGKKRECDLRKHMKRHTRPYGCTFPHCWKGFGSRNDWKRHESSQHSLKQMWRCNFTEPGTTSKCGKLLYHRDQFHAHLQSSKHHRQLQQQSVGIADLVESMRLGREGFNYIWCGFCNDLKRPPDELHGAWEWRFKHIGDHYDKDGCKVADWVCLEANRRKGDLDPGKAEEVGKWKGRVGKGSGDLGALEEEEDSDLGEDGIPTVEGLRGWDKCLSVPESEVQGGVVHPTVSNKRRRSQMGIGIQSVAGESHATFTQDESGGYGWTQ